MTAPAGEDGVLRVLPEGELYEQPWVEPTVSELDNDFGSERVEQFDPFRVGIIDGARHPWARGHQNRALVRQLAD